MPRALILGGAGFIGYQLAARLSSEGYALTLVDDLSRGRQDKELEALCARPGVTMVRADLTRPDALAELPRQWDGVYMLAAVVGVRNVETDPARVVRTNTLALMHLLDWFVPESGRPVPQCLRPPDGRRPRHSGAIASRASAREPLPRLRR